MLIDAGGGSTEMRNPSRVAALVNAATRRSCSRVVLVESGDLVRDCVANCLRGADPGFSVLNSSLYEGDSAQSAKAVALVVSFLSGEEGKPDMAVEVARAQDKFPQIPLVVVADRDELGFVRKIIGSGVRGYIPTSFDFAMFKEAIQFVAAGGTFVPASVLLDRENGQVGDVDETGGPARQETDEIAAQDWSESPEHMAAVDFTPRELAIISHLRDGKPNKLIARELAVCEGTVKIYIRRIMKKLRVENRTQAAVVATHCSLPGERNATAQPAKKNRALDRGFFAAAIGCVAN
jgi:DNA-binding NarL/FixJ family response regulator